MRVPGIATVVAALTACTASTFVFAQNSWVEFSDETATRLVASPAVGASDTQEKDYAWGDVDQDGDTDLVCVRKQPFTTPGRRTNVLFMNEGVADGQAVNGVLVDRTSIYATDADDGGQGFLDETNDRDVVLTDVNNDTWLDIVTVSTLSDGLPKTISHPRVYINKGEIGGVWQGFRYEEARIPQLLTIPGGLAVAPRLCSIAAADVDGDGFVDLYIGDYDSSGVGGGFPEAANADINDRLLMNDGTGHFIDSNQTRMNSTMLLSAFAMASVFADMNGDGFVDLVKDTALNAPQRVSVSYNNPANEGFFNAFDVVDDNAPYHITVGDLNDDNRMDIVVTDDGRDHYLLNQGNGPDGLANFTRFDFIRSSGTDAEFGGNSFIADMNNDGLNDVFICDVDVDIDQNCSRRLHLYRNLGNLPNVTLQEQGPVQGWNHNGAHDVAVFDINGDGWLDMVIGHCVGTNVWINVPPVGVSFTYPDGLPANVVPDTPTNFRVVVADVGLTPTPGTGRQFVSIDSGAFVESPMAVQSSNTYLAALPAVPCTSTISYYFAVGTGSGDETDPPGAATSPYSALSSSGFEVDFDDRFETAVAGWTVTNDPSLTSGGWERVNPIGTFFPDGSTTPAQPENDFGAAAQETQCYITMQQPAGSSAAGLSDVDGGPTTLTSPVFDLSGTDASITYARWFFCSTQGTATQDSLVTEISNGGPWVMVDETFGTGGVWEAVSLTVSDYVSPTSTVRVRFRTQDSPNDSITEAGIDSVTVGRLICPQPCIDDGDCDDGIACNGVEFCNNNLCHAGTSPCEGPTDICDEALDECVECLADGDCDDGLFCNGVESCLDGVCQPGSPPCNENLTCDEVTDSCVGCLVDGDCDDGNFCNGTETCGAGNVCISASVGVANNTFDGPSGWTDNIPTDGSISYTGQLSVTGPDSGSGSFAWASQPGVISDGTIEFDLLSYTASDTGTWDRPVFVLNGTFFGLNANGTIGSAIASPGQGAFGTINNDNAVAAPIHFVIDAQSIAGAGPYEIGFGVMSADGLQGAGVAIFDTVLPASAPFNPCPNQFCNDVIDDCVECLVAADCDDGQFCNGAEQCINGSCEPGIAPCAIELCDELNDSCPVALQPAPGDPILGLSPAELARFDAGRAKFDEVLTDAGGLGPIFNQNSCSACHATGGLGGSGSILVTRFGAVDKDGFVDLAEFGGSLLQHSSLSGECAETIPPEANVVANRATPPLFGFGLIEAISDADLLSNETTPPPGISGRAHLVAPLEDPGNPRVGRFGWKAQVPTVLTFSADASLNEMGLTNRFLEQENDPNGLLPPALIDCDNVPDPEDGPEGGVPGNPHFIDRVTDFQRFLAPPPQTPRSGMSGEAIFNSVGCADCHTPSFNSGIVAEAALSAKTVKAYSDFLLHDMGGLGDGIGQGDAGLTEMRTPPLWGLRLRTTFLHDGRVTSGTFADRVIAAVAAHGATGSEAADSAAAFAGLSNEDVAAMIAFMDSLGRREFDHNGDGAVTAFDLGVFRVCYETNDPFTADDACAVSDVDQDGDVDDDDLALLLTVYTGSQDDCNSNTINDAVEILTGAANDCNLNGVPDDCDAPFDLVAQFVQQLLLVSNVDLGPVCPLFDGNNDGLLDGRDVGPFTQQLIP
ncbi:MAG: VCBS repeat-containing protein [Phycisphaerales bacterium]|nr:VCBS repeat-containing protein [Phycisphaerales bacterium]MCB9855239.1 VCBS repeat-containing protein [Phycisphaerales bacterium]MCB9862832.1 VCBS repeat-containing protein [Phycisphaerales bacterium]